MGRPAQGRDLNKYKPRGAMVDANGDDLMVKINKVAAEMRAAASPSNHKDAGKPKAACGIEGPAREGKIVGGVEAAEHAWPWQVALFIDDAWFCGGSIISENYVLTASMSWPEPTTSGSSASPTVLRSPPTTAGPTPSGTHRTSPAIWP